MHNESLSPRARLIVALDTETVAQARRMAGQLADHVGMFKIGHKLLYRGGLPLAYDLARTRTPVFLDLKLHDIDTTVAEGVAGLRDAGISMVTVHGYPPTIEAAVRATEGTDLAVLAVTVLTSFDDERLRASGYRGSVRETVMERARIAQQLGAHGIVCAPADLSATRPLFARHIITPGIRQGDETDEHRRSASVAAALTGGADYLVVGRPIVAAADPVRAAQMFVEEIVTWQDQQHPSQPHPSRQHPTP